MPNASSFRRLLDLSDIHVLKARYCRFVDTKQWTLLAKLFTADAHVEGFAAAPMGAEATTFVTALSKRMANAVTVHHCHMPEIRFTGEDEARGIWAMEDYVDFQQGHAPQDVAGARGFRGYGHYEEIYRREDGAWRFAFMRLTRLRMDPVQETEPLPRPGLLSASEDWLRENELLS